MLQVTDSAIKKVQQLMAAENKTGYGLRVAVKGGGCSGFEYGLTFENEAGDNDQVIEFDGLRVFVDGMSNMYLEDISIDYTDGLQGSGFKFENPNAAGTCGCGKSFSV